MGKEISFRSLSRLEKFVNKNCVLREQKILVVVSGQGEMTFLEQENFSNKYSLYIAVQLELFVQGVHNLITLGLLMRMTDEVVISGDIMIW